jgi:hypothetical protein
MSQENRESIIMLRRSSFFTLKVFDDEKKYGEPEL